MLGLCCALALAAAVAWIAQPSHRGDSLDRLYKQEHWFEFRDSLFALSAGPSPFYRGALAFAFRDWANAEEDLEPLVQSGLHTGKSLDRSIQAAAWLFRIYAASGNYQKAWMHLRAIEDLRKKSFFPGPDPLGIDSFDDEYTVLSRYGDQHVSQRGLSRIPYAEISNAIYIPLLVNGQPANYSIDTGAMPSYLSQSEAERLGLKVDISITEVNSSSTIGVAVAKEVVIGEFHLRNVAFQVFDDDDMDGDDGVIGLPVLLALETLRWHSDGILEIGFPSEPLDIRQSNLYFDNHFLVTEAGFQNRLLRLLVDTGGYDTHLQPRFAHEFSAVLHNAPKGPFSFGELGAVVTRPAAELPELRLSLGSFGAVLTKGHHVLLEEWDDSDENRHGELGMDVLFQPRTTSLDLRAMRLSLLGRDPAPGRGGRDACELPEAFVCQPGWLCTAKTSEKLKCYIDRLPEHMPPGNALPEDDGDDDGQSDDPVSACPLPPNFRCPPGTSCAAVFDANGKCSIRNSVR